MRVSSILGDSLSVTLRQPRLWLFGLFAAAGGGASASGESGSQAAHGDPATAAASTAESMQELPASLAGPLTQVAELGAQVGEVVAANLPLVIGAAALAGLGMVALHIVAEGALIEGVSRKHRDAQAPFTLRGGFRLGWSHFGAVLGVKALALALGMALASLVALPFVLTGLELLPLAAGLALGLPLAAVAIPLGVSLYLVYALGLRVAVLENRRVVDALRRARRLLHGHLLDGIKLLLTVGIGKAAAQFIALPVVVPVVLVVGLGWLLGGFLGALSALILAAVPLALVGAALLGTWQSSVWTLGYLAVAEDGARA
jgi:hypothetical protein